MRLLLGDYIDAHPLWGGRVAPEPIARELAAAARAARTFAVLGNHDWKQSGDRMWSALQNAGIDVLENHAVERRRRLRRRPRRHAPPPAGPAGRAGRRSRPARP